MQPKHPKLVDDYIKEYLLSPYKIKILEVKNRSYKFHHGFDNSDYINKINILKDNIMLINANINHKYFDKMDILFRESRDEAAAKLGLTNDHITRIRREIKEQFYNLMIQEMLI